MNMPKVTVIIINFNAPDNTIKCIDALKSQTFKDFDVVLIDNGSDLDSINTLKIFLSERDFFDFKITFVQLNKNLGFSGGNNKALELSTGKYIALLNNDTVAEPNWLGELVSAMEMYPEVGACASKILVYDSHIIDSAGDGFLRTLKGYKRGEGKNKESYSNREFVFGACAAAALYRKEMIDEIGFLDEDFFLIHEDTDFNFRIQLAGWKVLYVPTAIVYHKVRSSIKRHSYIETFFTMRNSYLLKIKSIPLGVLFYCLPEVLLSFFLEFLYFCIKHRQVKLYFKAIGSAIVLMPKMLKKRKIILKTKKVDNKYLLGMLTPVFEKGVFRIKIRKFLYD
ncbi:MAG: glycosyltransferase family 2 protein [Syntrophorhabdaceae bacterium]|nr:glycosyltransferase family 2 protein [Syntrophorhabdaceae bacterium]